MIQLITYIILYKTEDSYLVFRRCLVRDLQMYMIISNMFHFSIFLITFYLPVEIQLFLSMKHII